MFIVLQQWIKTGIIIRAFKFCSPEYLPEKSYIEITKKTLRYVNNIN